jgi:CheY-like chemotaxis protein
VYAADGAAGLKMAEQHPPDLIVLDVNLPSIDGIELCRRLRAPSEPYLPRTHGYLPFSGSMNVEHTAGRS